MILMCLSGELELRWLFSFVSSVKGFLMCLILILNDIYIFLTLFLSLLFRDCEVNYHTHTHIQVASIHPAPLLQYGPAPTLPHFCNTDQHSPCPTTAIRASTHPAPLLQYGPTLTQPHYCNTG